MTKNDIDTLMAKLNYQFRDVQLLETSLRHRSYGKPNNERYEFLGDAIVNFIIGEWLFTHYPHASEGKLSRMRAALVNGETLAAVAWDYDLGSYLRLGQGELKSGGFRRESILADAMEAVIGAVYLDSDFTTCRERVLAWYGERLQAVSRDVTQKDAKTQLQEYLQAEKLPLPEYQVVAVEGEAHDQTFYVQCRVTGLSLLTRGSSSNRRKAEQAAAQRFLQQLQQGDDL